MTFVYPFASGVNPAWFDSDRETLYKHDHDMPAKKPKHPRSLLPKGFKEAGRKNKGILIRVTETQKRMLAETAKDVGLGLSSWMLSVALRAAHKMKSA